MWNKQKKYNEKKVENGLEKREKKYITYSLNKTTFYPFIVNTMEKLLKVAKQILHEVEENITVQHQRKTGMKVAVGYILDEVHDWLLELRINDQEFEVRTAKNVSDLFDCDILYDVNDVIDKQIIALDKFFTSLNKK